MNTNANPNLNQPESQQESKAPNGLGCLLTIIITLGAIILAGAITMSNTAINSAYGDNQYRALGAVVARLFVVIPVIGAVIGWLSYKLMARLLPRKSTTSK